MKKVVLVTGGFDPIHQGHIAYFKAAKELGDELWVGVNSDEWLTRKKGQPFMSFVDRAAIVKELACVDNVISFDDSDNSACGAIHKTLSMNGDIQLIFANGGDRKEGNVPEYDLCNRLGIEMVFGVGGKDKPQSSSWLVDKVRKSE